MLVVEIGAKCELAELAACVGVAGLVGQQLGVVSERVAVATEDRQRGPDLPLQRNDSGR